MVRISMSQNDPQPLSERAVSKRKRFRWGVVVVAVGFLVGGLYVISAFNWVVDGGPTRKLMEETREDHRKRILGLTNRTELVTTLFDWARSTNSTQATPEAQAAAQQLSQFPHPYLSTFTNEANGRVGVTIMNLSRDPGFLFLAAEDGDLPARFRHADEIATNIFLAH